MGKKYLNNFSLVEITEIHRKLNENPSLEYYFLDSDKNPVKVLKIKKAPYSGKIYDVDVLNDIVLVRRKGTPLWSGNSNTKAVDISKYGNNGTIDGAGWTSDGRFGSGLGFDGEDDLVNLSDRSSLALGINFTISAWVKPNSTSQANASLFTKGEATGYPYAGYGMMVGIAGNTFKCVVISSGGVGQAYGDVTSTTSFTSGSWYHVVCTQSASTLQIYVDGVSEASDGTIAVDTGSSSGDGFVGYGLQDGISYYFNGTIDELRVYNRSLSTEEIWMHYQSEFQKYSSTEWRFINNITNLSDGSYTYYGWANDTAGNSNQSEIRTLNVHLNPTLEFQNPTEDNNSYISTNHTQVNLTITEPHLNTFKFSWNHTNYPFYDDSLVLAMNFNNNSAIGECYDNETEILTDDGWKLFSELNRKEKVLTLNLETHEAEWQNPTSYQVYQHDGGMYQITLEDGSGLLVSPLHKVYSSGVGGLGGRGEILNPVSFNVIKLPPKSPGLASLSNLVNSLIEEPISCCGILNQTTENISSLVNSMKSLSFVTNTLCSDLEDSANLPFASPFDFEIMSMPCCLRNLSNRLSTFSSKRNLSGDGDADNDILFTSGNICCVLKSCCNMLSGQGRECLKNFFNRSPCLKHFQDLPYHNPRTFESKLPMTDLRIRDNILVNFNSHNLDIRNEHLNNFSLAKVTDIYSKLNENPCLKHYFLGLGNNPVKVMWIRMVPCLGRIHDVGVPNDIILVRKKGCGRETLRDMSERPCRSATKAVWFVDSNLKTVNSQADAIGEGVSFGFMSPDSNSSVANVINITNEGVLQK